MTKKKLTLQRKPVSPPPSTKSEASSPEWVVSMREYHRKTGLYRAEDLNRVLGDPRDRVQIQPSGNVALVCGVQHKN
jgi:hypothetical protein